MTVRARIVNPYIAGKSLGGQRGFFGRDDIRVYQGLWYTARSKTKGANRNATLRN